MEQFQKVDYLLNINYCTLLILNFVIILLDLIFNKNIGKFCLLAVICFNIQCRCKRYLDLIYFCSFVESGLSHISTKLLFFNDSRGKISIYFNTVKIPLIKM